MTGHRWITRISLHIRPIVQGQVYEHLLCISIKSSILLSNKMKHLVNYTKLIDAFSRNLDNWPKLKSNFLWKQIHSKTLFLVKVICSPTSLKVWTATLQEFFVDANVFHIYGHCFQKNDAFIIDYISTKFDPKSCMLNIILYIAIFSYKKCLLFLKRP